MKVEIKDSAIDLDATVKAELKELRKNIGRLDRLVKCRDEKIQELKNYINSRDNVEQELLSLKRKIKDFFQLSEEENE